MAPSGAIGGSAIRTHPIRGSVAAAETPAYEATGDSYILELRDSDGLLLRYILDWTDATWTQKINTPSGLRFRVPATAEYADWLTHDNEVWLYRDDPTRENLVQIQKFIIIARTESSAIGSYIDVECVDYLGKLSTEPLEEFVAAEDTVYAVVSSLMAEQASANPVGFVSIDSEIAAETISIERGSGSVLSVLMDIQSQIGGWIDAQSSGQLWWHSRETVNAGHEIHLLSNARAISRRRDWSNGTVTEQIDVDVIDLGASGVDYNFHTGLPQMCNYVRIVNDTPPMNIFRYITDIVVNLANPLDIKIGIMDATLGANNILDVNNREDLFDYLIDNWTKTMQDMTPQALEEVVNPADLSPHFELMGEAFAAFIDGDRTTDPRTAGNSSVQDAIQNRIWTTGAETTDFVYDSMFDDVTLLGRGSDGKVYKRNDADDGWDEIGSAGGISVLTVESLPAIPDAGFQVVYWTSAGSGTGDNQKWCACEFDTVWTPMDKTTDLEGTPAA